VLTGINFGLGVRNLFARLWIGPGTPHNTLFFLIFVGFFAGCFFPVIQRLPPR
jgi:hypothetical protein